MTEGDRDAEALIAIRKTNAMLRQNGMSWSDVIDLPLLAFFPLWIAAELMAIFHPNTYWNKNGKRVIVAGWSLCWLGLLSWLGAGTWLLFAIGT